MKRRLVAFLLATLPAMAVLSQNIGIGNTNPQYRLDLSGRIRIRGGASDNFTAGMWLGGFGADSSTNKMFFGMESDSTAGFYSEQNFSGWFLVADGRNSRLGIGNRYPKFPLSFGDEAGDKISLFQEFGGNYYGMGIGNSALQMMTPGSTKDIVFGYGKSAAFTENMRIKGNGNVGIKTDPGFPLSFQDIAGDKISLFKDVNGNYYGLGIGSSLMQLMTPHSTSDIVFGYGKSAAFTENMRIKGNGNIGIGVTDPAYTMDVASRMRIRSKPGFTAGIWLNNEANSALASFVGMQADNQVGFFGFGTGWGLLMNTQNGAISVGGSTGAAGQVLTSNGSSSAPSWQGGFGGGKHFVVRPSGNSPDLGTSGRVDIPNMVANFTLAVPSQVVFNFKISIANRSCFGCGDRRTFIVLIQNVIGGTTDIATTTVYTPNGEIADGVSGPIELNLPAGTYSYKLAITPSIFGAATVYARRDEGIMTWQIYPN